ncbi:MAG: GTP-binding protein, partial [Acetobacteraceae bacterium]|nr:GTP-binding protein [Acetobacteraceae bacterium]
MTESLPVNVITGFLGSGKTTLLRHLLAAPELGDTAVLINEFGDVGLDHLLVETLDEGIVLLQSGCVCCTIRSDLSRAILDLYSRRQRGLVPPFARLAVETTGLADPTPILATILHDPVLRHHFQVGNVVTTVDGVNGLANLEEHPETVKQAAIADRLVVTKTDLADATTLSALRCVLRGLNPAAPIFEALQGNVDADRLLGQEAWNEATRTAEVRRWLAAEAAHSDDHEHPRDRSRHARDISAFCLISDQPIEWATFGIWLTLLLHRHGSNILRVKGILNIAGSHTPVLIQGVQHVVHKPSHL